MNLAFFDKAMNRARGLRPRVLFLGLCVVLITVSLAGAQETIYVDASASSGGDGSASSPYSALAAATGRAVSGDTILVRRGAYSGPATLAEGVSLLSEEGWSATSISTQNASSPILTLGNNTVLRGFRIGGTTGSAVALSASAAAEITNTVFYESAIGLLVPAQAEASCLNNVFYNNTQSEQGYGILAEPDAVLSVLLNSIFAYNSIAVEMTDATITQYGYNDFYQNTVTYQGAYPHDTDLPYNPLFSDEESYNFHLRLTSQVRDAGDPSILMNDRDGSRNDPGADGGPFGIVDMLAPRIVLDTFPSPPEIDLYSAIQLDASACSDDWGINQWLWDFNMNDNILGDKGGNSNPKVYTAEGLYLITLEVTDNSGLVGQTAFNVRVGNPPIVTVTPTPAIGPAPLTVNFEADVVSEAGRELEFEWDFNGNGFIESTLEDPLYTYLSQTSEPGLYRALLTVTDSAGVFSQVLVPITVSQFPVLASASLGYGLAGSVVVDNPDSSLDTASVSLSEKALNESFSVGISAVDKELLPVLPSATILTMADLSPHGVLLAAPVTVSLPLSTTPSLDRTQVFFFDKESQTWIDDPIRQLRLEENGGTKIVFETTRLGILAVTQTEDPTPPGPCFIATAAYGSPLANDVDCLRHFRDAYLLSNSAGSVVVDVYYRLSPPLADHIARHPLAAAAARVALTPVVVCCKLGTLSLAPLAALLIALIALRRKRRQATA